MLRFILLLLLTLTLLFSKENALIEESSPYLKRHAHNPVNWYAWNETTLKLVKKENKPIFLSIGYSTCHWCHVMEEESFEHQDVADILNEYFISIKVDKEEFPNIDKKYQNLFRAYKGRRGGWPLSVFLIPTLEPYFITTYMPRGSYGGTENIIELTTRLGKLYNDKPKLKEELEKFAKAKEYLHTPPKPSANDLALTQIVKNTVAHIKEQYDPENSGFSMANTKFPEASKIELLLKIYRINGDKEALKMAKNTLLSMSKRGIYDQIDGGFFRYSDKTWAIPHFQKLLYVNAQLVPQYLEMYRISKDKYFFNIAKATIDEMERHYMEGGHYFSASDSVGKEGIEGLYYTYMYDDVLEELLKKRFNEDDAIEMLEYLTIEELGNLDGELSHVNISTQTSIPKGLEGVNNYLKELRTKRNFPFLDKKIITAWNAMMVKSLYIMAQYDKSYLPIAEKRLDSLLALMLEDKKLYHQTLLNQKPTQIAQLEDYAYLVDTLLTAHQVTLEPKYIKKASLLAHQAKKLFNNKDTWYMSTTVPKVKADFDDK
ncbi:MAG: thioredoxin domain-containing protein, partial [Sulfurovaceae bacterium]|nr:thioredoxin domain-containing protein [Sulfurovaceae bacterium]